jgi:hypothetical protein
MDYKFICSYIADPKHYTELFGDGSQTSFDPAKLTKSQVFNYFLNYMNTNNKALKLTGTCLRQRFDTYKAKYHKANDFKNNTGTGILESEGFKSLAQKLNALCPSYDCMDALFGLKANVTAMALYNVSKDTSIHDIEIVDFN